MIVGWPSFSGCCAPGCAGTEGGNIDRGLFCLGLSFGNDVVICTLFLDGRGRWFSGVVAGGTVLLWLSGEE